MKEIKRLLVLQHLEIEGPGLFEQFAKERDLKIEIIRLDNKNALPQTKKGDLILIMGGPMGVKDIGSERYPWLKFEHLDKKSHQGDNSKDIHSHTLYPQYMFVELNSHCYPSWHHYNLFHLLHKTLGNELDILYLGVHSKYIHCFSHFDMNKT